METGSLIFYAVRGCRSHVCTHLRIFSHYTVTPDPSPYILCTSLPKISDPSKHIHFNLNSIARMGLPTAQFKSQNTKQEIEHHPQSGNRDLRDLGIFPSELSPYNLSLRCLGFCGLSRRPQGCLTHVSLFRHFAQLTNPWPAEPDGYTDSWSYRLS
ncbi:hypothetical protein C8R43DRAFT_521061 [Mycena crocata]|nr:hypothetical protein C8R43DRAFT_520753 [Mycena crocata]KAJ7148534.1 hypothetical protein C8R43DRAFT_521061 [Mycena crocata]